MNDVIEILNVFVHLLAPDHPRQSGAMDLPGATGLFLSRPEEFLRRSSTRRWLFAVLASIDRDEAFRTAEGESRVLLSLSLALEASPHCWRFALNFLSSCAPPFAGILRQCESETEGEPDSKKKCLDRANGEERDKDPHDEVLSACLRFVSADSHFRHLWPWSKLFKVAQSGLLRSRRSLFLASEVLGVAFGLSEGERREAVGQFMTEAEYMMEAHRHFHPKDSIRVEEAEDFPVAPPDLPLACVEGVVLPRSSSSSSAEESSSPYVPVPSHRPSLRRLALCAAAGQPALLSGPPGCGKTSLVERLRDASGRREFGDFHRVQVSDETDSRYGISVRFTNIRKKI